jgi:hypothetical protein
MSSLPDNGSHGENIESAAMENEQLACDDRSKPVCPGIDNAKSA